MAYQRGIPPFVLDIQTQLYVLCCHVNIYTGQSMSVQLYVQDLHYLNYLQCLDLVKYHMLSTVYHLSQHHQHQTATHKATGGLFSHPLQHSHCQLQVSPSSRTTQYHGGLGGICQEIPAVRKQCKEQVKSHKHQSEGFSAGPIVAIYTTCSPVGPSPVK